MRGKKEKRFNPQSKQQIRQVLKQCCEKQEKGMPYQVEIKLNNGKKYEGSFNALNRRSGIIPSYGKADGTPVKESEISHIKILGVDATGSASMY